MTRSARMRGRLRRLALHDGAKTRAEGDHGADRRQDLAEHASCWRLDLAHRLLGLDLDQGLAGGDRLAWLLQPGAHRAFADGEIAVRHHHGDAVERGFWLLASGFWLLASGCWLRSG